MRPAVAELAVALHTAADFKMAERTRDRLQRAVPDSTRRAYAGDLARFQARCHAQGRSALPATGETLADYAAQLAEDGKATSSIRRAMSAIGTAHKASGLARPDTAGVVLVLRSYGRDQAEAGVRVRKAPPVTVDVLRALVDATDPHSMGGLRDRALLVLGFALGARRSELVALDLADVTEALEGLVVLIRQSKTDKDSAGAEVAVPFGSHPATCPVRTVRAWRDALTEVGIVAGPLFRRIDRHGRLGAGACGRGASDRLGGQAVGLILRRLAERAQTAAPSEMPALSAHSLRAGFATAAYRSGADPLAIPRHGRWQDGSPALLGYIRSIDRWSSNPLARVGL